MNADVWKTSFVLKSSGKPRKSVTRRSHMHNNNLSKENIYQFLVLCRVLSTENLRGPFAKSYCRDFRTIESTSTVTPHKINKIVSNVSGLQYHNRLIRATEGRIRRWAAGRRVSGRTANNSPSRGVGAAGARARAGGPGAQPHRRRAALGAPGAERYPLRPRPTTAVFTIAKAARMSARRWWLCARIAPHQVLAFTGVA